MKESSARMRPSLERRLLERKLLKLERLSLGDEAELVIN